MINHYLKADRIIKKLIAEGKKNFILFPFGEQGMMIKSILNQRYGIQEAYIIDNGLANHNANIRRCEFIKEIDCKNFIFLITSDNEDIYSEIRFELMKYVELSNIVDVFSNSMYFDSQIYYDNSNYSHPRLSALEAAAREIYYNNVDGAIAEVGVYRGWFANHMSRLMPDRTLYLYDTFNGFDSRDITEEETAFSESFRKKTNLNDTTIELAMANIAYRKNVIIKKGYFPDTVEDVPEQNYAFVSLDTDLYKPILAGLEYFYPRLSPGGYIFVDDLRHPELLGVRKAVIDYCKQNKISYMSLPDGSDATAVITKSL